MILSAKMSARSLKLYFPLRVKIESEQLPCEQFLQAFEIYRALLCAKQVGEKCAKIQNPVKSLTRRFFLFYFHSIQCGSKV